MELQLNFWFPGEDNDWYLLKLCQKEIESVLTFEAAIESMEGDEKPSILIANGFSQSWNAEIFNYANLYEAADFGEREKVIHSLFNNLATFDFETIMKQLEAAEAVLAVYGEDPDKELIKKISSDKSILKDALITAISNTHPDLPSEVSDQQFVSARKFLLRFNKIFSINYDLLFYWARNKCNLEPIGYKTFDGFGTQHRWKGGGADQNVHFLHGGLHIYDTGSDIKKHAFTDEGGSIIKQVRKNLNSGNFPLFVSEPSYQKKKQQIEHNPYLNYCFQALRGLTGTLFIHGHSMDENDKHIFDQIKSSRVTRVFVSIYGDENSNENSKTIANSTTYLNRGGVKVVFYKAESAPIWS